MMHVSQDSDLSIGKSFRFTKKLGQGAFGDVYLGVNVKTGAEVAIKLESKNISVPQLLYESELYNQLHSNNQDPNDHGIPFVYFTSTEGNYNYMVMDRMGLSLEQIFQKMKKKFSMKTIVMIGLQMLDIIEFVHSRDIIHRDIKPDNFLLGLNQKQSQVYLIDFGLAKKFVNNNIHIPMKENKTLTGTCRYVSINTHLGLEQSRRDDLESLSYCLLYFLNGQLPWQNLVAKGRREKYDKIMEKKMLSKISDMCTGHPPQFGDFLKYCRQLEFTDKPDYKYLRNLLL